jgi:quercetin 2,3-dioxygenase
MKRRSFLEKMAVVVAIPTPLTAQKEISKPFWVDADKSRFGESLGGGSRNDLKVSGNDTDGQWAMFEIHSKGKTGPALHIHFDQDETVNILEGDYLYQIGDEKRRFKTGDTIFIPRGTPHAFLYLGEGTGRKLSMYQPANNIEEMFRKIGQIKERTPENVQAAMKVNNSKVVGGMLKAD